MAKFRVTTTLNEFTVECETFDRTVSVFGQSNENLTVTFYDTKVSGEKEIRIVKAVVSANQFVSAVRE